MLNCLIQKTLLLLALALFVHSSNLDAQVSDSYHLNGFEKYVNDDFKEAIQEFQKGLNQNAKDTNSFC